MDDNDIKYRQGKPTSSRRGDRRTPYVRKPRPRRTQEAIYDLEQDSSYSQGFTHDSNISVGGRHRLSGTVYSRSRGSMPQLQRSLRYGQYLEIPKGRRQIFSSRERSAAIRSRAITAAIVILLIVVAIVAIMLIQQNA